MACKAYNIKCKKQDSFKNAFSNYLDKQILCDVTLTSEGKFFKAHRFVLASCSKYFENIFLEIPPNSYPVVILKDITSLEIEFLLSYMYKGDVTVPENFMSAFLQTCKELKIEGLYTINIENSSLIDENTEYTKDEKASSNNDVFHSLMSKTVEETIISEKQIENKNEKQTSVLDSQPVDSQKSFVFRLNQPINVSKTPPALNSEAATIGEKEAEIMEVSDDEDSDENIELQQPHTEENHSDSEDLSDNSNKQGISNTNQQQSNQELENNSRDESDDSDNNWGVYISKTFDSLMEVPQNMVKLYCPHCKRCVKDNVFKEHIQEHHRQYVLNRRRRKK
ncbi:protein abrupt-like [Sitophilus oryzae]|uniref:Protein abrupt-like n=1 Tax=Sitophilus oryzae TaxID=7048 RepID=A0A6J2XLM9_SITOR|nr:protein abrupt-like [Sitophilus oryzae]